jgi:photosystem II stability/assembly factor-like uncharacterized protein
VAWHVAGELDQPAWQASNTATLTTVTCPEGTTCYAAHPSLGPAVVEVTTDGGATWSAEPLPDGVRLTSNVSCPTADRCVGLGYVATDTGEEVPSAVVTTDGGATWSVNPLPTDVGRLHSLACPSRDACIGVGYAAQPTGTSAPGSRSVAVTTTDGAGTWTTSPLPSTFAPAATGGIGCMTALDCVVVGTNTLTTTAHPQVPTGYALSTTNGGTSWSPAVLPSGTGPFLSVSCSINRCLASSETTTAGDATPTADDQPSVVLTTTTPGRSWTTSGAGLAAWDTTALSCPTTSNCWVGGWRLGTTVHDVTATILTTDDAGATWKAVPLPPDVQQVSSIACWAVTGCLALASQTSGSTQIVVLRDEAG